MAMRSQVYAWDASNSTTAETLAVGQKYSIFIGGVGNNITKPAETTATQFVVIEDVAVSGSQMGIANALSGADTSNGIAGPRAYGQVRINTTDYFLDPDNIGNDGIPGTASPYPRTVGLNLLSTYTLMFMCYRAKHGIFYIPTMKVRPQQVQAEQPENTLHLLNTRCMMGLMHLSLTNC